MFKKLKDHFLILNMTIISLLMIVTFSIIYLITYNNTTISNGKRLASMMPEQVIVGQQGPVTEGMETSVAYVQAPVDYSLSFHLVVDEYANIVDTWTFSDLDTDIYSMAWDDVLKSGESQGKVRTGDKVWLFQIQAPPVEESFQTRLVTFLDITESEEMLTNLAYTLVAIAVTTLVLVFFISVYFSRKAIKPIEKAWEKQNQFIADASHEFKTPLAIILANADAVLSSKDSKVEDQEKWLHYIKEEVGRMNSLVGDLLCLAQMEEVDSFSNEFVNISQVVKDCLISFEAMAFERQKSFVDDVEDGLYIEGDEGKLRQVICILMDNSIKHSAPETKIVIQVKKDNKQTLFSIANELVREEAIIVEQTFDRFYRGDSSREHGDGGFGLGLSIAKSIVEKMGGKLLVHQEGKKIEFQMVFE